MSNPQACENSAKKLLERARADYAPELARAACIHYLFAGKTTAATLAYSESLTLVERQRSAAAEKYQAVGVAGGNPVGRQWKELGESEADKQILQLFQGDGAGRVSRLLQALDAESLQRALSIAFEEGAMRLNAKQMAFAVLDETNLNNGTELSPEELQLVFDNLLMDYRTVLIGTHAALTLYNSM